MDYINSSIQVSVSIIIPCYNVRDYIEKTIQSVLNQTSKDFELILVDDGSSDDTYDIIMSCIRTHPNCRVFKQSNKGVSAARNYGMKQAKGRFIYFLDGDDYINPRLVQDVSAYSELKTELVIMGYDHEVSKLEMKEFLPSFSSNYLKDYLLNKSYICICSIVFSHLLIERECLSFNENTFYSEDREFIAKALNASNKVALLESVYFHYAYRPNSAMKSVIYSKKRQSSLYAMERVFKFFNKQRELQQLALLQLDLTILLHYRLFYRSKNSDVELENRLLSFLSYLKSPIPFIANKNGLFVYFFRFMYLINKKIFHFLIIR